eukprot:TRINITY_DN15354_c0_g1_i1.p1 TRINITY_DN15354_c0_g1~~TRINITY_DN15354_c0_g1_i1.p1  ORF type:complete len:292 (-),score=39.87 TRINITY_DN15354_c0_g1_i1:67-942(-)
MKTFIPLLVLTLILGVFSFSSDYVLTPGGYRHIDCVHQVNSDEIASKQSDGSFIITSKTGESDRVIPACLHDKQIPSNNLPGKLPANGWQVFTYFNGTSGLNILNGTWNVPPAPASYNSQTVFLFTSLVNQAWNPTDTPTIEEDIIQPVLQYGTSQAGGGKYWSAASWYVGATALYTKLIKVDVGDIIFGAMVEDPEKHGSWTIITTLVGGETQSLTVDNLLTQDEPWATVTLEVYGVNTCDDLPNQNSNFYDLVLESNQQGNAIDWIQSSTQVVCNEATTLSGQNVTIVF